MEEKDSSLFHVKSCNPCCGLAVIFCGFISHLIGREAINIPEIFSGVHGFTGKTVSMLNNILPVFSYLCIQKQTLHQAKALHFSKTCQLLVERLTEG